MLTNEEVENLQKKQKKYTKYDAKGLFICVFKRGSKAWYLKWQKDKKIFCKRLGFFKDMTVEEAREKAKEIKDLIQARRSIDNIEKRAK